MQRPYAVMAMGTILSGLLLLLVVNRDASRHPAEAHDGRPQVGSVCPGFVVLPNGFAVLSGAAAPAGPADAHMHHAGMPAEKAMAPTEQPHTPHASHDHAGPTDHDQMAHTEHEPAAPTSEASAPLMGYAHGDAIRLQEAMLCVPIGRPDDTAWMAVSRDKALFVMAESLRGPLTHNSRDNEGFHFTIMQSGSAKPIDTAHVRLLARMPHHDRHMPGGHGLANDPDVHGLMVEPDERGLFTVRTVDFSMAGPWLFEVQVQLGKETVSAYFAASVGEQ